jgi:hypothetical protein
VPLYLGSGCECRCDVTLCVLCSPPPTVSPPFLSVLGAAADAIRVPFLSTLGTVFSVLGVVTFLNSYIDNAVLDTTYVLAVDCSVGSQVPLARVLAPIRISPCQQGFEPDVGCVLCQQDGCRECPRTSQPQKRHSACRSRALRCFLARLCSAGVACAAIGAVCVPPPPGPLSVRLQPHTSFPLRV